MLGERIRSHSFRDTERKADRLKANCIQHLLDPSGFPPRFLAMIDASIAFEQGVEELSAESAMELRNDFACFV